MQQTHRWTYHLSIVVFMCIKQENILTGSQYSASVIKVCWLVRKWSNSSAQIQWHIIRCIHVVQRHQSISFKWRSNLCLPATGTSPQRHAPISYLLSKWGSIHHPHVVRTWVRPENSSWTVVRWVARVTSCRHAAIQVVRLPHRTTVYQTFHQLRICPFIIINSQWQGTNVSILLMQWLLLLWYWHRLAGCDHWWWWCPCYRADATHNNQSCFHQCVENM